MPTVVGRLDGESAVVDKLEIVKSKTLAMLVQERIIQMIRDGELASGAKLVEAGLTSRFNVNRAAVREAFRALEEAGLVKLEKNRGVFVHEVQLDEALDLYEMRACFEEMGTGRAAESITDAHFEELMRINDRLGVYAQENAIDNYYPLNIAFHDRIFQLSENNVLLGMYRRLADQMHLLRQRGYEIGGGLSKAHAEHDAILKALATRNVERAAKAARMHALDGMQRYIELRQDHP